MPHCLGALDGRHMQVMAPKASGSTFFNYKKTFSVVLLALVDADYTFLVVDVGAEGSLSDPAVLKDSLFGKRMAAKKLKVPDSDFLPNTNSCLEYFFVGDNIFQLRQDLMKPFSGKKLTYKDAIFNYRLSRARRVVENAFGILVARWQIFRKPLNVKLENANNIILATICLHNFIMRTRGVEKHDEYLPPNFVDVELQNGDVAAGQWRDFIVTGDGALQPARSRPRRPAPGAIAARNKLVEYVNGPGAVSWQDERVMSGFWGAHVAGTVPQPAVANASDSD